MTPIFTSRAALRGTLLLSILVGTYAVSGCGSDSTDTSAGGSGGVDAGFFPGPGGATGFGGATTPGSGGDGGGPAIGSGGIGGDGAGGGTGSGGAGTAGATGDAAVACVVPDAANFLPTDGFKDCPTTAIGLPNCTNGKCVPAALVPTASQSILADCAADMKEKCVPTYFVERNAKFLAPVCTSLKGAEGRCLSQCIPQVAAQETFLPKDSCSTGDLCAPCYDPRTGKDTGACSQGCDKGPTTPAVVFDKCCKGSGSCVPKKAIPAGSVNLLGADTCKTAGELCAPDKLTDTTVKPKVCTSIKGAEGRCLADCIPKIAEQASRLRKDTCDTNELCAPCFDPISGDPTGSCSQNGDAPTKPKVTFDTCCTSLGHCVPGTILTADQTKLLGADTCTTSGELCAPDVFSVAGAKADTCRALGSLNAEGRCTPSCLPSIQSQRDRLDQGTPATCATGTLCAPCYDPLSGAKTGACDQNGDSPKEVPKLFPSCCGGLGSCVAPALVPADQKTQLGHDTCGPPAETLCAPKALGDPTVKPKTCRAPGDIEARCLPACLPPIAAQASSLRQQTCATGELCADCYNPIDGTDTKACRINGDVPAEAKKVFAGCCPYPATNGVSRGKCVPPALLSSSQASSLPQDSCASGSLCAPNLKVMDQSAKFPTCKIPNPLFPGVIPDDPGACVPDCIITDTLTKALLLQRTCAAGELCAPCKDPLSGKNTGACD